MSIHLDRRSVAAMLVSLVLGLPAAATASGIRPLPASRAVQSVPASPSATYAPLTGHVTLKPKDTPDAPTTNTATTPPAPPQSKAGPGGAGMMIDPNG
ncbi:MAG TPA: hypothetical protein VGE98_03790 [Thermoanaerobaculia bacterium]